METAESDEAEDCPVGSGCEGGVGVARREEDSDFVFLLRSPSLSFHLE